VVAISIYVADEARGYFTVYLEYTAPFNMILNALEPFK
jgi:hypothetical protein